MPEQIISQADTQGQDPRVEKQGESSIQRLKRQRSEAMEAARRSEDRVMSLEQKLNSIEQALSRLTENPRAPKDYSENDLLNIATSEETLQDKPQLSMRAMAALLEKKLENSSDALKKSIFQDIDRLLSEREREDFYKKQVDGLIERFGRDNLSPGSDLHDRAEEIFKRYVSRYRDHSPEKIRDFKIWAVKEAAEELGLSYPRKPSETTKPESLLEPSGASSQGEDKVKAALDKGNWKEAIRAQLDKVFEG